MRPYKTWSGHHPNSSSGLHQIKISHKVVESKYGLISWPILVALLVNITVLLSVFTLLKEQQLFDGFSAVSNARSSHSKPEKEGELDDELLGGLLHSRFDERSCPSRYQSVHYLKGLKRQPSPYLISKLRSYEVLHRQCGPYTEQYNKTVQLIQSGGELSPTHCKYVIWTPCSGMGNRILTLASTFIYAILTNRILLMDFRDFTSDLFCEPFPETSWILPRDFPIAHYLGEFNQTSPYCHGYMVKNNLTGQSFGIPPFIYLNLIYDMDQYDESFFRDTEQQTFLNKVPWIIVMSDEYFIPSLFMMKSFKEELENMFPDKDSVFHLLGRYLFHPTELVWGLITRYYQAYLARADDKIGVQIRVFDGPSWPQQHVFDQIITCTSMWNILPPVIKNGHRSTVTSYREIKNTTKVVLVTSLNPGYSDAIRLMYSMNPTETGEVIQVHQPSYEVFQKMEDLLHYTRALTEIYLLAMSDTLVTSAWSTFGYVAQGFGGIESWVMYKPENDTVPDPSCGRVLSMEPCFHLPPSHTIMEHVSYVRPCEDKLNGLKLYRDTN